VNRIQRSFALLSVILNLAFLGAPIFSVPAVAAANSSVHDGRLGGSQASFDARFGKGTGSASKGITYAAAGYDAIFVKFDKNRADDIVLKPAAGASWTTDQAVSAALDLLPKDVKLDAAQHDTGDGRWELACTSKDLGAQFDAKDYKRLKHNGSAGDCFDLESPDSPSTIGAMELSIGRAGSLDRPAPTPTPSPTAVPTPTPDNSTFVGQDGCTYRHADGALVSCPAPTTTGSGSGTGSTDTGTYTGGDGCTYRNVDNVQVSCPSSDPTGATAQCNDGTYSYSLHASGTCSHHGGVARWINYPG
jgi:Protein of unknown function (DUF3761)